VLLTSSSSEDESEESETAAGFPLLAGAVTAPFLAAGF